MIQLINLINGHIRHSTRLVQLHRVCQVLNINVIYPLPLTSAERENGWFSGFFDADGTITMSMKGVPGNPKHPQLSIRVTNKLLCDVQWFSLVFGGNIYFDNSQNGYYQWSVQSREKIMEMSEYFRSYPSRSHKSKRIHLIKKYYELLDLQAYKADSNLHKAWLDFQNSWLGRSPSSLDDLGG
jgi:LAGLIDADG endonuclease